MDGPVARLALAIACCGFAAVAPARGQAPTPAAASAAGLVVVESAHDMAETERRLVAALDGAGLKVAARVDHMANAKSVGLDLKPTVLLLFGNPKAGTGLIATERTMGIDLPLKALIYEADGKVRFAYNDPAYLARRHGIDAATPVLAQIAAALRTFATAATAQ